jgi:hypothetical protein
MSTTSGIALRNFFVKLFHWEYWPFGILQFPAMVYWLWLSLKARSLFFFTASNPGIEYGGMMGESKFDVLRMVPPEVAARTIRIEVPATAGYVMQQMAAAQLAFPVIFKPDLGERGWLVKKIKGPDDIEAYLNQIRIPFLIQEFIDLPMEFGLFYVRHPDEAKGRITSLAGKKMLHVTGDGKSTLRQLILASARARIQWKKLQHTFRESLNRVLMPGEKIELVSIGNHCLGTKFLDRTDLITPELEASFDRISRRIEGFYYGRFDLRAASVDHLREGRVKVMELNGVGAEPAHIYQPGFSFWKAVRVLLRHWHMIYRISMTNAQRGYRFPSWGEGVKMYHKMKAALRS